MKNCPACGGSFTDDLRFCLHDGTILIDGRSGAAAPTAILGPGELPQVDIATAETIVSESGGRPLPHKVDSVKQFHFSAVEPSTRLGCVMSVGQISAAALVLVVGLFALSSLFTAKSPAPHASSPMSSASNASANATRPQPSISPTPTPRPTQTLYRTNTNSTADRPSPKPKR